MHVLAIDPGTTESAFVLYDAHNARLLKRGKVPNEQLRDHLYAWEYDDLTKLVIEMVASYGAPVGKETFETVRWIGRFEEAALVRGSFDGDVALVYRNDVKMHLCHTLKKITDGAIRQCLVDRFGPTKEAAIGKKKNPGPLYGVSGDEWQALALAVTFADKLKGSA
jgi:hypothetical protein